MLLQLDSRDHSPSLRWCWTAQLSRILLQSATFKRGGDLVGVIEGGGRDGEHRKHFVRLVSGFSCRSHDICFGSGCCSRLI